MPQMSPLNWMVLYIYFLLILLIVNVILNYLYLIEYSNIEIKKTNKVNLISYKWMW